MNNIISNIISAIKLDASIPTTQGLFTSQRFVDIINRVLIDEVCPLVMKANSEYFVDYIESDFNQTYYNIPSAAMGNVLRSVQIWSPDGKTMNASLVRLFNDSLDRIINGYYVEGNKIKIYPETFSTGDKIRLYYYKRPSLVVLEDKAALITSVSGFPTVATSLAPSAIQNGTDVDVISSSEPYNVLLQTTVTGLAGNDYTFSSGTVADFPVGSYICVRGESVYPQLPSEIIGLLIRGVVVRCLKAIGNSNNDYAIAKRDYEEMKEEILNIIADRVDGDVAHADVSDGISFYV